MPRSIMHRSLISISAACVLWSGPALFAQSGGGGGEKFPMLVTQGGEEDGEQEAPAINGRLAVQAVQGTPDGPPIGVAQVDVQLIHRGMVIDTLEAELDEHGVAVIEDFTFQMPVQPVVIVSYGGVMYQKAGEMLDPAHPEQTIEVVCYEVTDEQPEWAVKMRHLMVGPAEEGLRVTEIMVIENPAPRTWLGAAPEGERPVTSVFDLPSDSGHVELGRGFHDWCCSTFENGQLVNHLPIMPGTTEMSYSYIVHENDGEAALNLVAPAAVSQMMVMVPVDMQVSAADALTSGGTRTMGQQSLQLFSASDLSAGSRSRLVLAGLTSSSASPSAASHGAEQASSASPIKLIAAIGGGLLLLVALVVVLAKSPRAPQQA